MPNTFHEIIQSNPEARVDAEKTVHEGFGMGCWHEWTREPRNGIPTNMHYCPVCSKAKNQIKVNPSYATSLDAWIPVWEKMEADCFEIIPSAPVRLADFKKMVRELTPQNKIAKAPHISEAALRMLDVPCEKCEGQGITKYRHIGGDFIACKACTDGKVNAYELFMTRFGG